MHRPRPTTVQIRNYSIFLFIADWSFAYIKVLTPQLSSTSPSGRGRKYLPVPPVK